MSSEETLPQTHRYPMGTLGGTGEDDVDLHYQANGSIVSKIVVGSSRVQNASWTQERPMKTVGNTYHARERHAGRIGPTSGFIQSVLKHREW
jgi:hypothetical protein